MHIMKSAAQTPSPPQTIDPLSAITRISEADLLSRFSVSRTTIYRLRKAGLPCVHIGRRVLYNPTDVAAWIAQHGASA